MSRKIHNRLSYARIIALGYFLVILTGTLLLLLPAATVEGKTTTPIEALFTATSATCVTGLIVVDTGTHWTLFGQIVVISMIQVGGLGFMTMGVLLAMFLRRRISLSTRSILQESLNTNQVGGIVKLAKSAIIGTAIIEGTGAVLLSMRFIPQFGIIKGIYYGIFHSISAFCNGGFDVLGSVYGEYASVTAYSNDILVNVVIMLLIIIGGIGFTVWMDVKNYKFHFKKYTLHSKVVISASLFLIIFGSILFMIFERNNLMKGMGVQERILSSAFSAVTARTAGFNTIDTGSLTQSSMLLTSVLMVIGGSPGSTAGGVKTITVVVLLVYVIASLRGEKSYNVFGRRFSEEAVKKASIVVTVSITLILTATIAICALQPLNMDDILFEVCSAIGTVGMSTGVTRELNTISRLIIITLMYCGRIGSMSFAISFMEKKKVAPVLLPEEKVMIG